MKSKGFRYALLTATLLLSAITGIKGQSADGAKLIVSMKAGYYASFSTTPRPSVANISDWSNSFAEADSETNTIRRIFIDKDGSLYFGYALVIEPIASAKQFKISVRPLGPEDEQELSARKSFQSRRLHPNYNPAAISRSSAPQIIRDGDTFALDVLVNPQTGEKITDIVTVSASLQGLAEAPVSEAPRDFTLADVEMKMINYRLLINGELAAGGKQSGACAGPLIWFHMPEHGGRFIFSVMPHPGYDFRKIGVIENNKIKFTLNGESYEWISNTPVVSQGGNWNLYVLYDSSYVPDPFLLGVNNAAKIETRNSSSGLSSLERSARQAKAAKTSSFDKSSGSKKEETASPARLIIGASDRPENLLPKN
jgi:hypothetical protein